MNLDNLIKSARGGEPVDMLMTNARIVNVFSGEIVSGNIAVNDGYIVGFGSYSARKTVDIEGRFAAPGFIDSHVHIESSMASVTEFARSILPFGTTSIAADPHEIANVLGADGIRYMLKSAEGQPMNIFYTLPSCVPATDMETSGAKLGADELAQFMGEERILALAELMNYPGVIYGSPDVLDKIRLAKKHGKPVDGHSPGLSGFGLNAYLSSGISSDHECTSAEEALEKLRAGMFIMIREGTGARNLDDLFPIINEKNFHRMMWCTDDRHAHDILDQGHIDYIIRRAVALGLDPVTAIQMGTLNPARYFNIRDAGAVAPGYKADIVIFSDINNIKAEQVWCGGILAAENGKISPDIQFPEQVLVPRSMNLRPESLDFSIPAEGQNIRLIEVIQNQVVTSQSIVPAKIVANMAVSDISRDIIKIAVVERYTGKGNTGRAFVKGMGLKRGALASSVAHDSHNIIVSGTNDEDMKAALEAVVKMGGGMAVSCDGKISAKLPLPIAGLMSHEAIPVIRKQLDKLISAAAELGSALHDPFMTLGFLALPVIPELKITDKGLVDVKEFQLVSLFT